MNPVPFEVEKEVLEDGICALTVRGELDLNTAPELEQPLEEVLAGGQEAALVIDLSQCEFIDSTGIALIVRAWQRLDRGAGAGGGGRLVLCCFNHQVQRLLKITGVDASISTHEGRDSAIEELRG